MTKSKTKTGQVKEISPFKKSAKTPKTIWILLLIISFLLGMITLSIINKAFDKDVTDVALLCLKQLYGLK